jgi:membrane protein
VNSGRAARAWAVTRILSCRLLKLYSQALAEFRRIDGIRSSAAVAYFALLSFLPFLIMTLAALGFVLAALGRGYATQEEFITQILDTTAAAIPFWHEALAQRIRELIQVREAMGIVGGVALVLTSSLVFSALEDALNRIFEVRRHRHVVKSKLIFVGFVATLGVFAVITHYVTVFADSFIAAAGGKPLYEYLYSTQLASKLIVYLGTVIAFVALLRYFCRERVRLFYLWLGASIFYLLFELAKLVFSLYLEYVAQLSALYGSLSTLMVLIIWTFYTVVIFLWSAAVVKVLAANAAQKKEENLAPEPSWPVGPGG